MRKSPSVLLVDTFDRFSRSFRDYRDLEDIILEYGHTVIFLSDNLRITPENFEDKEEEIINKFNQSRGYIRSLKKNVKRGNREARRQGIVFKVPEGYIRKYGEVAYDEDKLKMIKLAFELVLEAKSQSYIRDHLNTIGWKSVRTGKKLTGQTLFNMLRNPFYSGFAKHYAGNYAHCYKTIITPQEFEQVQHILNKRKSVHQKANKVKPYIFRNPVKCQECGRTVNPDSKKDGRIVYYRCVNKHCSLYQHNLREEELVKSIQKVFENLQYPEHIVAQIVEKIKQDRAVQADSFKSFVRIYSNQIQNIKEKQSRLLDLQIEGSITSTQFKDKNNELENELKDLELKLEGMIRYDNSQIIEASRVFELAKKLPLIFQSSNIEEKQKILNFMISNAYKQAHNVELELKQPFNILLKYNNNQSWFGDRDSNPS